MLTVVQQKHGIKANLKTEALINALNDVLCAISFPVCPRRGPLTLARVIRPAEERDPVEADTPPPSNAGVSSNEQRNEHLVRNVRLNAPIEAQKADRGKRKYSKVRKLD